jgi:hypothetical protein
MRTYCLHCHGWPIKDGKLDPDYKDGGQGFARREARNCTDPNCPLFPYRPGASPWTGRPTHFKKADTPPCSKHNSGPGSPGNRSGKAGIRVSPKTRPRAARMQKGFDRG